MLVLSVYRNLVKGWGQYREQ